MMNNTQTQQNKYSQMSDNELKERERELVQKIAEQKKFLEEEMDREMKAHPETKAEWEEMKKAEKEAEEATVIGRPKENKQDIKSPGDKKNTDIKERMASLRQGLYTTAMEHDKNAGSQMSNEQKKEIEELREKMRILEKKKEETADKNQASEMMRAIREKSKGVTKNKEPFGQDIPSSAVEQKMEDIEKNRPKKEWVNSGTRKEIVEMLREQAEDKEQKGIGSRV